MNWFDLFLPFVYWLRISTFHLEYVHRLYTCSCVEDRTKSLERNKNVKMKTNVVMVLFGCGFFLQIVESASQIDDGTFWIFTDAINKGIYCASNSSKQTYLISVQRILTPIAVHYNEITQKLYWSDVSLKEIRSTSVDKADDMLILGLDKYSIPDGLAVDETYNLLFYSDAGNHLIALLDLDGLIRVDVITEYCDQPRAIVLDPDNGKIYWTDWGKIPKIESANYDGTNRKEIIKALLLWPNALSIDFTDKWIYWGDAGTHSIEKAKLDGTHRQVIFKDPKAHFFSLIVEAGVIFYTDWQHRSVRSVRKDGKDNRAVGPEIFDRLNDLTRLKQMPKNPRKNNCMNRQNRCSHICLPKPNGKRICLCPAGFALQNETYCIAVISCRQIISIGVVVTGCDSPFTVGTLCEQDCADGYEKVHGTHERVCKSDGDWSGQEMLCKKQSISCQPINSVGVVVTGCDSPFTVGTLCEQECADGYEKVHGTNTRVCKSDGDWSGQEMLCKKQSILCPELFHAPSVLVSGCKSPYVTGSVCGQDCVAGYSKIHGSDVRVCKSDGTWSGQDLLCNAYIAEQNNNNVSAIVIAAAAIIVSMLMTACGVLIFLSKPLTAARNDRQPESVRHGSDEDHRQ